MAKQPSGGSRKRGFIEQRGNSLRVKVYAGVDPMTGKRLYLTEPARDEKDAQRVLNRLLVEVDKQRKSRTKANLRVALADQLKFLEIEESTRRSYEGYIRNHIDPLLGDVPISKITARVLEEFYAELRRCRKHCDGKPAIDHRSDSPHECQTVKHKRPPGRPPAGESREHDCAKAGCVIQECPPHVCVPLSPSTVSKIHHLIGGTLDAAVRWEWIDSNPADVARRPRQPAPQPDPPSVEQVAQVVNAAWDQDPDWGMLVWLVMVTGLRRAELLALRWRDFDLTKGHVTIQRNYLRLEGRSVEKDTKTHRMRRLALDPATVELLNEHRESHAAIMRELGSNLTDDAFLFSHEAVRDRPYDPDAVTHRYAKMCAKLGIDSHLHALRHYSATELLSSGVDLRTVAGRLGHGGGGATTLRVYAAWVGESDRRAADILGGRMKRPVPGEAKARGRSQQPKDRPSAPDPESD